MTNNKTYQRLIHNLEEAINNLQDAFKTDQFEGRKNMYNLREFGKDLSWKKCQIMDELLKLEYMKYEIDKMPF